MNKTSQISNTRHPGARTNAKPDVLERMDKSQLPLTRPNFIMMAVAGVMIVLGFLLMAGGASEAGVFNPEIFSTRRIVVGPTIAFAGFIFMGVAIMYTPRSRRKDNGLD